MRWSRQRYTERHGSTSTPELDDRHEGPDQRQTQHSRTPLFLSLPCRLGSPMHAGPAGYLDILSSTTDRVHTTQHWIESEWNVHPYMTVGRKERGGRGGNSAAGLPNLRPRRTTSPYRLETSFLFHASSAGLAESRGGGLSTQAHKHQCSCLPRPCTLSRPHLCPTGTSKPGGGSLPRSRLLSLSLAHRTTLHPPPNHDYYVPAPYWHGSRPDSCFHSPHAHPKTYILVPALSAAKAQTVHAHLLTSCSEPPPH